MRRVNKIILSTGQYQPAVAKNTPHESKDESKLWEENTTNSVKIRKTNSYVDLDGNSLTAVNNVMCLSKIFNRMRKCFYWTVIFFSRRKKLEVIITNKHAEYYILLWSVSTACSTLPQLIRNCMLTRFHLPTEITERVNKFVINVCLCHSDHGQNLTSWN